MSNESLMVRDSIREFIDELKMYDSIRIEEIPEYRLFVSQIEEFFDKKLGRNIDDEEERKTISKTMIQNYIKDGLIMPPEGKSYNSSHIMLLAIIHNLKSILAIKDIKKLLLPILEVDDDDKSEKIGQIYNNYIDLKESYLDEFADSLEHDMERIKHEMDGDMKDEFEKLPQILLILTLTTQANICKRLSERIIDLYFDTDDRGKDSGDKEKGKADIL